MLERPVIAIVEDDPSILGALLDALNRRFGADYLVVPYLSPRAALEDLARRKADGAELALVIADQWMPEMTGSELLARVHDVDRAARRAMLASWGDWRASGAILEGCAFGKLDNYLLKPWSPAEVHLYPQVSEFLAEWTEAYRPQQEIVRVIGDDPSTRSRELQDFLQRNGIPHRFYDAAGAEGHRLLRDVGHVGARLPVVLLLDGRTLVDPENATLADVVAGLDPGSSVESCDLAVVGAGPAGLSAAVYAASEGLRTCVIEREAVGGQAGMSALIRNYVGFPRGVSGAALAQRAYEQAWLFGAKYVLAREVTGIEARGLERAVLLSDGRTITARAVLVATGAAYRRLGVPSLERLVGRGFYYVPPYSPLLAQGRDVYVVGGGNSAGQAVLHLSRHARRATLVVRGGDLERTMSDYLIHPIRRLANIEVRLHSEVVDGGGESFLDWFTIRDTAHGVDEVVKGALLFVLVGALPRTDWLGDAIRRDRGYVVTGSDLDLEAVGWPLARAPHGYETSLPGVFAAGDVRAGSVKRVASAVGEGAVTVQAIHEYLAAPADLSLAPEQARRAAPARGTGAAPAPPA
jgi:thioredoxin reductase (NADPH)